MDRTIAIPASATPSRDPTTFGQHAKKARLECGLTQKGLAQMVGVCETTVANWEKSKAIPSKSMKRMPRLCEALSLDIHSTF
ncbi:MAG: helix-turn-helix transcriptional regulator, partial [Chloroflexota bacterium]